MDNRVDRREGHRINYWVGESGFPSLRRFLSSEGTKQETDPAHRLEMTCMSMFEASWLYCVSIVLGIVSQTGHLTNHL